MFGVGTNHILQKEGFSVTSPRHSLFRTAGIAGGLAVANEKERP